MLVLKASLEKETQFMIDLVLDRAVVTPDTLVTLIAENQKKLLISLITKPIRPLYLPPTYSTVSSAFVKGVATKTT